MKKVIRNSVFLLFLFFDIFLMSSSAAAEIPEDAVKWTKNQHYYAVIKEEMNPVQANDYCKKLGGYLATVSSKKKMPLYGSWHGRIRMPRSYWAERM